MTSYSQVHSYYHTYIHLNKPLIIHLEKTLALAQDKNHNKGLWIVKQPSDIFQAYPPTTAIAC